MKHHYMLKCFTSWNINSQHLSHARPKIETILQQKLHGNKAKALRAWREQTKLSSHLKQKIQAMLMTTMQKVSILVHMIHTCQYKGVFIPIFSSSGIVCAPGLFLHIKINEYSNVVMQTTVFCFKAWRNISTHNEQIFMSLDAIVARQKIQILMVAFQAMVANRDKCKSMQKSTRYWSNRRLAQALNGWKGFAHRRNENIQKVILLHFLLHSCMVAHPKPSSYIPVYIEFTVKYHT